MELFRDLLNRVARRARNESAPPNPGQYSERVWSDEYFRAYLLALGGGSEFLLPLAKYPDAIYLNSDWHNELDRMRALTMDGRERYTPIVFNRNQQKILIPQEYAVGEATNVPGETVLLSQNRALAADMDGMIGDIHSHPTKGREDVLANFSPADLYSLVVPFSRIRIMMLVDGDENLIALQSKETPSTYVNHSLLSQESFSNYWLNTYGYSGPSQPVSTSKTLSLWNITLRLARKHHLVIYGGSSKEEFTRLTPAS